MTHSSLLRVISYLGLRASRKTLASNSIAASPNPNWRQEYSKQNRLILARREACFSMGQASSSSIPGDSANANESQKELEPSEASVVVSPEQALTSQLDTKLETILLSEGREGSNSESRGASIPEGKEGSNPGGKGATISEGKEGSNPEGKESNGATIPEGKEGKEGKGATIPENDEEAERALKQALEELGEPPERPLAGDCCGQGCDVCVWDTYNDELRDYLARRKALLKSPSNRNRK